MIDFTFSPPFFRLMQKQSVNFSERLRLTTFFGKSGKPRKYKIENIRRANAMEYGDSSPYFWFPVPDQSFRDMLIRRPTHERRQFGSCSWMWTKDRKTLLVRDDFEFLLRADVVNSLINILFGNEDRLFDRD